MKLLLALVPAVAALVAAWPIVDNYFYADDFAHLFELASFGPRDFLIAPNAGHMYLVRNAVFYASFLAFGMEPAGYFALAIATHVANVLLLFAVLRRLTGTPTAAPVVACLGAVLFAVSPANLGTLGWYSVYGHALAATATLFALLLVAPRPGQAEPLGRGAAAAAAVAMLVASQCFGTGAAVAVVFPVVALLLRPATLRARGPAASLAALPVLVLLAWWGMNSLRSRLNPWGVEAATGMAALATDYRQVARMTGHLLGIGIQGLVLGPVHPLAHYGDTASLVAIAVVVGAVAWALLRGSWWTRRAVLAFLLAAATCYLAVAAGRAALFTTYAHDRLLRAFTDATRYQYLGQALLAVVVGLVLDFSGPRAPWGARTSRVLLAAWALWALATAAVVQPPADALDSDRPRVAAARDRLERAIRSQPPGSSVCLPIEPAPLAFGFPGSLGLFVLFHPTDEVEGRRVYFVSSDPALLRLRDAGGRMRRLLVPAGACPPRDG